MTRKELVQAGSLPDGGGISKVLDELEKSGFITSYAPYGKKKKGTLFRLTDEYSLFYLKFIEPQKKTERGIWQKISKTPEFISWSGYSFESLCLKHIDQIKKALGISGIYSQAYSFFHRGSNKVNGFQIDLLIERDDNAINLCEIKFYRGEYSLQKEEARNLRNRIVHFQEISKTKKHIFLTMISTYGVIKNEYSLELVDQEITMNAFFVP